jgi:hypothetical protein
MRFGLLFMEAANCGPLSDMTKATSTIDRLHRQDSYELIIVKLLASSSSLY